MKTISYNKVTTTSEKKFKIKDWTVEDCARVQKVFSMIEGKYTLLILAAFMLEGEMSFGRLKRELNINAKTLTLRLNKLLKDGLIKNRKVLDGKVSRSFYSINGGDEALRNLLLAFKEYSYVKIKR